MHMCMCKMCMHAHVYVLCRRRRYYRRRGGCRDVEGAGNGQLLCSGFACPSLILRMLCTVRSCVLRMVKSKLFAKFHPNDVRRHMVLQQALPATRTHIQSKCRIVSPAPGWPHPQPRASLLSPLCSRCSARPSSCSSLGRTWARGWFRSLTNRDQCRYRRCRCRRSYPSGTRPP